MKGTRFPETASENEMDKKYLIDLINAAKPFVEDAARMDAVLTRFAPLPPEAQAKHDSTQSPAEKWLDDYHALLTTDPE